VLSEDGRAREGVGGRGDVREGGAGVREGALQARSPHTGPHTTAFAW
jgi:hypothetical protein